MKFTILNSPAMWYLQSIFSKRQRKLERMITSSITISNNSINCQLTSNFCTAIFNKCFSEFRHDEGKLNMHTNAVIDSQETPEKLYSETDFDRDRMLALNKKHFFYDSAFSIYGGLRGQFDYGPPGSILIENILQEWNKFFVLQEDMIKMNCCTITPTSVLKASGHIKRFSDIMVKDTLTGENFRADQLVNRHLEELLGDSKCDERNQEMQHIICHVNEFSKEKLNEIIKKFDIRSPSTRNSLSDCLDFNLMFPVSIGATGNVKGFLRPETSQGMYINFKKLYDWNRKKLPFACAQVGLAFRNELYPESALLRTREFLMAEIGHFSYPDDNEHPKFNQVRDTELCFYSRINQLNKEKPQRCTVQEALQQGLVKNQTMGFYLAKIREFLLILGIDDERVRFREHLENELAHYSTQCWDAECLTSYGWVECVGCAYRGQYDLDRHQKDSGCNLSVDRDLEFSKETDVLCPSVDEDAMKKVFRRKERRALLQKLSVLTEEQLTEMDRQLSIKGAYNISDDFQITRAMIPCLKYETKPIFTEQVLPVVVEPSFGIGRIFYAVLEHSFKVRKEKESRTLFAFRPIVAPIKVAIITLSKKKSITELALEIVSGLKKRNIANHLDDISGRVGKSYVKWDELGVPFILTVDFDSIQDRPATVTIRERDTTTQARIPVAEAPELIRNLVEGTTNWKQVCSMWPAFVKQENIK